MDRKLKLIVDNTGSTHKSLNPIRNSKTSKTASPKDLIQEYMDKGFDLFNRSQDSFDNPQKAKQLLLDSEGVFKKAKLINGNIDLGNSAVIDSKLGEIYLSLGRFDDAINCFDSASKLLSLSSNDSLIDTKFLVNYHLGLAHYEKGCCDFENVNAHWDKSIEQFNKALDLVSLCPNKERTNTLHGDTYQYLGLITLFKPEDDIFAEDYMSKINLAKSHFENAIKLDPKLIESQVALSCIETETGNAKRGNEYFDKAWDIDFNLAFELSEHFTLEIVRMLNQQKVNEEVNKLNPLY